MSKKSIYNMLIWLLLSASAFGQNASPIIQPHMTFVDASGSPCANCRLYSYAAGTTTPLATFTDAAGVSQNTNPVVLGADGGPLNPGGSSGAIWLGTNSYKLMLKDPLGSTIWTVDQVKAGGGGSGGSGNPNGFGTVQTSTKDAKDFLTGGVINSDAENSLNNGPSQTQLLLCGAICSMTTPPTSTDTSVGGPLPVLGSKVSSMWEDKRYNSQANWNTNPIPQANALNSFPLIAPSQTSFPSITAYTKPFPAGYGYSQGSAQNGSLTAHVFTAGYSLGNLGGLFPSPAPGYPNAAPWAGFSGDTRIDNFNGTGIRQASTWLTNCFATGDCQTQSLFHTYMGGCGTAVSDECDHGWGSAHLSTGGDVVGTILSVADTGTTTGLMKFKITVPDGPSEKVMTLGQERYMFGYPIFTTNADKIILPASGSQTPASVVFNDITIPVSPAWGFFTSYCDPAVQDVGVGIGKNGSTVGCDVTVLHGTFDQTATVCTSSTVPGLTNYGSVVVAPPTALTGGHQTLQITMHKPAPANAVIYQGGGCGMGINWLHDVKIGENSHLNTVSGSVVPCVGSSDAHTLLCQATLPPSSHAGTREVVNDFGGPTPGPHAMGFLVDLSRTGGVVSGMLGISSFVPTQIWNSQLFAEVENCTDTSFNGQVNVLTRMPGPDVRLVQWNQTGADSAGCTGALMYPIGTETTIVPIVQIYAVANPAVDGTVNAEKAVDGYVATGVNSYFATTGHAVTSPTHYAASADGINLDMRYTQPLSLMSGINLSMEYNAFEVPGGAAITANSFNRPEHQFGTGGNGVPIDFLQANSPGAYPWKWFINSSGAPSFLGGGIRFGPCSGFWPADTTNDSFCDYTLMSMSGGDRQFDTTTIVNESRKDTIGIRFFHSTRDNISLNATLSKFDVPTAFNNAQFESNIGGVLGGNYIPTTGLGQCTTLEPNGTAAGPLPCYRRVTSNLGSAVPTSPGSPITNRVIYLMIGTDDYGLFASPEYVEDFSPSPITPTFSNTVTCKDLPTGKTAKIYLVQPGTDMLPVTGGNCTAPTDTVVDIGTYDSPTGPSPDIAGTALATGAVQLNAILFNQADHFGTTTPADTVTTSITQTAPATLTLNGTTLNDGQGSLILKNLTVSGTCTGCGGGGGSGFPITLGSTSIAGSSTTTAVAGLSVNGVTLNGAGSSTLFLNQAGGYTAPTGGTGLSGMTAGQVAVAATATTVTSSMAIAGAGTGLTTGPNSGVTPGDIALFTGTGGQITDGVIAGSDLARLSTTQTFTGTKTLPSPVFTGVPVAPTAAPGTNTTQVATTAYVLANAGGTVTHTGALTANAVMLGNGTADSKVDTNFTSDGSGNVTAASYSTGGTKQGFDAYGVGTGNITATLPTAYNGWIATVAGSQTYFNQFCAASPTAGQVMSFGVPSTVNLVSQSVCTWLTPVTAVSVATANGISGTSSGGATPALTLTLGAITPTSTNGVSAATMAFNDATSSIQTQLNAKAPLVSPSFTTPTLGVAAATTINKVTITAPATSATLTILNGKTLTANNSLTLAGTDSTTMTFPSTSATITQTIASGQTAVPVTALAGNTCDASATTATATGAATTDAPSYSYASDPTAITGYGGGTSGGISFRIWTTSNTFNFKRCNETSSSITPGALNINWRVTR